MTRKVMTSLSLEKDVKDHIDHNVQLNSFAEWVNNTYRDEFMILEKEKEHVKALEWELQLANERVRTLEKTVNERVLSIKAEEWLRTEGLRRSKINGVDLDAVRRYFNTEFSLQLGMKELRLHLDRIKNDN